MKNPIENLNKVFDSRVRLGIMSALMVNHQVNFNELKELIEITDGNLASHIKSLEENGFVKVQKGFIGKKTNTIYSITKAGEKAFKLHIEALEKMIKFWVDSLPTYLTSFNPPIFFPRSFPSDNPIFIEVR